MGGLVVRMAWAERRGCQQGEACLTLASFGVVEAGLGRQSVAEWQPGRRDKAERCLRGQDCPPIHEEGWKRVHLSELGARPGGALPVLMR